MTFGVNTHPIAFHVEDMEAARAELESRGVEFAGETLDTGVCLMAFFRDPPGTCSCCTTDTPRGRRSADA